MKKISILWWIIGIVVLIAGLFVWSSTAQKNDTNVIARGGIHWHSTLEIYVSGEKIEIPQNVGIGAVHMSMHTHDDLPIIHMEFSGLVREEDTALGKFFEYWGKDMRSFGENMRMTVNGAENVEFENYRMKDGDVIELRYD